MQKERYEMIKEQIGMAGPIKLREIQEEIAADLTHGYYGLPNEVNSEKLEILQDYIEDIIRS